MKPERGTYDKENNVHSLKEKGHRSDFNMRREGEVALIKKEKRHM